MHIEIRLCGQYPRHAVRDIAALKARLAVTPCIQDAVLCRHVALAPNMDTNIVSDYGVSKH